MGEISLLDIRNSSADERFAALKTYAEEYKNAVDSSIPTPNPNDKPHFINPFNFHDGDFKFRSPEELVETLISLFEAAKEYPELKQIPYLIVNDNPHITFALAQYARSDPNSLTQKDLIISIFDSLIAKKESDFVPEVASSASRAYASLIITGSGDYSIDDLSVQNQSIIRKHLFTAKNLVSNTKSTKSKAKVDEKVNKFLNLTGNDGVEDALDICADKKLLSQCYIRIQEDLISPQASLEKKANAFQRLLLIEDQMIKLITQYDQSTILFLLSTPSMTEEMIYRMDSAYVFGGKFIPLLMRGGLNNEIFRNQALEYLIVASVLGQESSFNDSSFKHQLFFGLLEGDFSLKREFVRATKERFNRDVYDKLKIDYREFKKQFANTNEINFSVVTFEDEKSYTIVQEFWKKVPKPKSQFDQAVSSLVFVISSTDGNSKTLNVLRNKAERNEEIIATNINNPVFLERFAQTKLGIDPKGVPLSELKQSYRLYTLMLLCCPQQSISSGNSLSFLASIFALSAINKVCKEIEKLNHEISLIVLVKPLLNFYREPDSKNKKLEKYDIANLCRVFEIPEVTSLDNAISNIQKIKSEKKRSLYEIIKEINDWVYYTRQPCLYAYHKNSRWIHIKEILFNEKGDCIGVSPKGTLNINTGEFDIRSISSNQTGDTIFGGIKIEGLSTNYWRENEEYKEFNKTYAQKMNERLALFNKDKPLYALDDCYSYKQDRTGQWIRVKLLTDEYGKPVHKDHKVTIISSSTGEPLKPIFFHPVSTFKEARNFESIEFSDNGRWLFANVRNASTSGYTYFHVIDLKTKRAYPIRGSERDFRSKIFYSSENGERTFLYMRDFHSSHKGILYDLDKFVEVSEAINSLEQKGTPSDLMNELEMIGTVNLGLKEIILHKNYSNIMRDTLTDIKVSPTGKWSFAYIHTLNGYNILYNLDTLETYGGGDNRLTSSWDLVFSPDDKWAVVEECKNSSWSLKDLNTGATLIEFMSGQYGHRGFIETEKPLRIEFSPDGRWMVVYDRSTFKEGVILIRLPRR